MIPKKFASPPTHSRALTLRRETQHYEEFGSQIRTTTLEKYKDQRQKTTTKKTTAFVNVIRLRVVCLTTEVHLGSDVLVDKIRQAVICQGNRRST